MLILPMMPPDSESFIGGPWKSVAPRDSVIGAGLALLLAFGFAGSTVAAENATPAAPAAQYGAASPKPDNPPSLINGWLRSESSFFDEWDFGGQFRMRYEHAEHLGAVTFGATGSHIDDDRVLLRTFAHVGYNPVPWFSVYAEARDSRGVGDEPIPNPDEDTLDLHQAFVRLGNAQNFPLTARIGRQELIYGDERLIGASDWTNFRRTFDAARL